MPATTLSGIQLRSSGTFADAPLSRRESGVWVPIGGAAPVDPSTITGYLAHYDASTLAFANNDPVDAWPDLSPTGYDGVQATSGNRPVFKTNIQNSLPGVLFDGTTDYINLPQTETIASNFAVFYCFTPSSGGGGYGNLLRHQDNKVIGGWHGDSHKFYTYPEADPATGALAEDVPYVFTVANTTGTWTVYQSGVAGATGSSAMTCQLDTLGGVGNNFKGYIFEVIVYDAALSAGDRGDVEDYLIDKWGI